MDIATSLYTGKLVSLGTIDYDKDPEIESRWTHDPLFMRQMSAGRMRPLSPFQIRKKYEEMEKEDDENRAKFHFRVRRLEDDALLGFGELLSIQWMHGGGYIRLGIGDPSNWRKGYGSEALSLLLRFAFSELNLFRLSAEALEYNEAGLALFRKAGFVEEVCRREVLCRDNRRWDAITLGLLAEEWRQHHA